LIFAPDGVKLATDYPDRCARVDVVWLVLYIVAVRTVRQKARKGSRRKGRSTLERQYMQFFTHNQHFPKRIDRDDFYYDPPSPLKWVPTETTYGIGFMVPVVNA
jgi:hypothetical protein